MSNAFERTERDLTPKQITTEMIAQLVEEKSGQLDDLRKMLGRPKWAQTFDRFVVSGNLHHKMEIKRFDIFEQAFPIYILQAVEDGNSQSLAIFLQFIEQNPLFIELANQAGIIFCGCYIHDASTNWRAVPSLYPAEISLSDEGKALLTSPGLRLQNSPIQIRGSFTSAGAEVAALLKQPIIFLPEKILLYVMKYQEQLNAAEQNALEKKRKYLAGRTSEVERKRSSPILVFTQLFQKLETLLNKYPTARVEFSFTSYSMIADEDAYMINITGLPDDEVTQLSLLPEHPEIVVGLKRNVRTETGFFPINRHFYQIDKRTHADFHGLMLDYAERFSTLRPTTNVFIDTAKNLKYLRANKHTDASVAYHAVPRYSEWQREFDSTVKIVFTIQTPRRKK